MDEINFLLTEVSLELLGNRFYDIHGESKNGLAALYASGPMPLSNNLNCDLIKKLDMEYLLPKKSASYNQHDDFLVPMDVDADGEPTAAAVKIRRTSFSVNEHETKHISMAPAKIAKVKRRRQTTVVSSTAKGAVSTNQSESDQLDAAEEKARAIVVKQIKKLVESGECLNIEMYTRLYYFLMGFVFAETLRMLKNSDRCKDEYFIKNSYRIDSESIDESDIVDTFYAQEKDNLSLESIKLMQLIKFMKSDPRNSNQMKTIAANILYVKDLI